jgi:hypothetical protein
MHVGAISACNMRGNGHSVSHRLHVSSSKGAFRIVLGLVHQHQRRDFSALLPSSWTSRKGRDTN